MGLGIQNVGIFYGHLEYFIAICMVYLMAIWYILRPLGVFAVIWYTLRLLLHISLFWYVVSRNIWQSWCPSTRKIAQLTWEKS
jgi:hypothetical protein